jgi:hypothetical protein
MGDNLRMLKKDSWGRKKINPFNRVLQKEQEHQANGRALWTVEGLKFH